MNKIFKFKKSNKKTDENPDVLNDEKARLDKTQKIYNKNKADIKKYVDQEGITIKKLETGLWFVSNIKFFNYIFHGALIVISVITWSWFIYSFGHYVIKGMKDDNTLAYELVNSDINHDATLSQKAFPLQFGSLETLKSSGNIYDFYIKVTNPNDKHLIKFSYYIKTGDVIIGQGENFIFPLDSKYILVLAEELNFRPVGAELFIEKISYERIIPRKYKDWDYFSTERLNIIVEDKVFNPAKTTILTEKLNLNELTFRVTNKTAYNYYEVNFIILLKGITDIVGVSKYTVIDFYSNDTNEINVTWPGNIGKVNDIEIIPEIDITDENNYINFEGGTGEEK